MATYQQRLFGGETKVEPRKGPDEALARRLERMALNREFHSTNQGNLARSGAIRQVPNDSINERIHADTRDYGLQRAQTTGMSEFTPFSHGAWRRFGKAAEVPVDTLYTAQAGVDRRRVNELVEDPTKGVNPRLPDELPYVLRGPARVPTAGGPVEKPNVDVVINGNHRVAAQTGAPQQTMFVPARVVENTPQNRAGAQELEHQRGMLQQTAEGARMLREGSLTGISAERTREFVESQRAAYRGIGRQPVAT